MARKRPDDTLPPTFLNARLPGGVCRSEDGSLWLYRRVPLGPVADAITPSATLQPGRPIMAALQALSTLTPARLNRRSMARGSYRQVHLLGLNLPTQWVPERDKSLSAFLASAFPDQVTHERLLLLGVRLIPGLGSGGFRSAVNSIADFLTTASTPMSDFAGDIRKVGQALTQAGLDTPSAADFQQADSWWSLGRSDAPLLPHADHMHVFGTQTAANEANVGASVELQQLTHAVDHEALGIGRRDMVLAAAGGAVHAREPRRAPDAGLCAGDAGGLKHDTHSDTAPTR